MSEPIAPAAALIQSYHSCASLDIKGLEYEMDADAFLVRICHKVWSTWVGGRNGRPSTPFVTFSGICKHVNDSYHSLRKDDYAAKFAAVITENKVGDVVHTKPGRNWTGNMVQVYTWLLDYPAIQKFLVERGKINPADAIEPKPWRNGEPL